LVVTLPLLNVVAGGITPDNAHLVIEAGANALVAGSAVFGAKVGGIWGLLGPCCWDLAAGTLLLGPCCWDLAVGTLLLGPYCWDLAVGTLLLGPYCWDLAVGTLLHL
jgi:hypothetical protein